MWALLGMYVALIGLSHSHCYPYRSSNLKEGLAIELPILLLREIILIIILINVILIFIIGYLRVIIKI